MCNVERIYMARCYCIRQADVCRLSGIVYILVILVITHGRQYNV